MTNTKSTKDLKRAISKLQAAAERPTPFNRTMGYVRGLWRQAVSKFTSEKLVTVRVPLSHTMTYHYSPSEGNPLAKHATQCALLMLKPLGSPIPRQSAEMFQMKAISLLERYGIATNPEAREKVRHTPIETRIAESSGAICTLKQTISLFPGQTIVVMGHSALDPKTQLIDRIFPETFSISLESTQTGYPHPSQRCGWSLANELLPEFFRKDLMPNWDPAVFNAKQEIRVRLQPHGDLISRAKRLLRIKRKVVTAHQDEFVELHRQLAVAIASQAGIHDERIDAWFNFLKGSQFAYDQLVEANELCSELMIAKPFKHLQEAIVKDKETSLLGEGPQNRRNAAQKVLDEALSQAIGQIGSDHTGTEKLKWDFVQCMGAILGRASQSILLQYLSDDLDIENVPLNPLSKRLQQAAYAHVKDFIEELLTFPEVADEKIYAYCYTHMKELVLKDLEILG